MTQQDFDQARALLVSYAMEGADDSRLPEILMQIRETCGHDAFNRLLVLSAASDDPRFDKYGCADVLPLLRDLTITDDLKGDVERLLEAMRQEDTAIWEQARRDAAEQADPFRRAVVRLYRRFREPNLSQVLYELQRL